MSEMIPRDENDDHSAVLELRAGMLTCCVWEYIITINYCAYSGRRFGISTVYCRDVLHVPKVRCGALSADSLLYTVARYAAYKKWDFETLSIS